MGHSFGFSGLRRSSGFYCQNESRTAVSLRFFELFGLGINCKLV